jgi:hypothetical protein
MYILGLSSSWGTSQICRAWSPSGHQLAPALSPIWGPCPKPCHLEEVVYSPNDSCSHFTQCLFPPKLPQQHTYSASYDTFTSFIPIIHLIHTNNYLFYLHNRTFCSTGSVGLHGRPAALSLLCPLHYSHVISTLQYTAGMYLKCSMKLHGFIVCYYDLCIFIDTNIFVHNLCNFHKVCNNYFVFLLISYIQEIL